jgi:hypothetical protein
MLVGEVAVEQLAKTLVSRPVRLVVDAQPALLLYGLALVVELLLRDHQRAHAIRFQEQRQFELVRGQRLEVQRQVAAGGAVHRAAVGEHLVEVLAVADVVRALEHHVLEQMGEAGATGSFVARADVVGDVQCDDRGAVILDELHAQAVGERDVGEFDADGSGLGFAFRGTGHASREQDKNTHADCAIHGVTQGRWKSGRG